MEKKKKIHKLTLDFDPDFALIAIASHENDYRLTWSLNKSLGLNLKKVDDLEINHLKHKILCNYSMYSGSDKRSYANVHLISNKSERGFLIPTFKNIDFILRIANADDDFFDQVLAKLKKIDIVITAFTIENISEKVHKMFVF